MQLVVRGYETQVKVFLLLVVLFLVTANLVTVTFLTVSEDLLLEEARARVVAATQSLARQAATEGLAASALGGRPGEAARAGSRLSVLGRSHGASVAEIVDLSGRVLASSQSWRLGMTETFDSVLDPAGLSALMAGRPAVAAGGAQDALTHVFAPLAPEPSGGPSYLRAGYALAAAGAITRQVRFLTWAQAVGGTIVLVMVLLFTRFVLKPYRMLREAAADLPAGPAADWGPDDPAFLVASFRGVVDKMKSMESELERMKSGGSHGTAQESLLASLSSGILILDGEGRVAALNPAGESILGLPAPDVLGRKTHEIFAGSPEFASLLEGAARYGRGCSREVVAHRLPGGRSVHLGVTASGPPGGGTGALCLFSDLTEIRGLQARVLLKENLARVGELSAGIAHEFRNSLATILGYARLAAREEPEGSGNAQAIIREVKSMERVVDEFLRYAGPARLQKSDCDLRSIIQEVSREVVRGAGEEVAVSVEGDWPDSVRCDEILVRQAFHNLLRNAVEAALAGTAPRKVTATGRVDAGGVSVTVSDTGPGFSEDVLGRLFTPFVTTKDRGTGLGMALAQKIVVSHDGSIEAANQEGGGARITVTLPLEEG